MRHVLLVAALALAAEISSPSEASVKLSMGKAAPLVVPGEEDPRRGGGMMGMMLASLRPLRLRGGGKHGGSGRRTQPDKVHPPPRPPLLYIHRLQGGSIHAQRDG
jgi:hypothetical protein